MSFDAKRQKNDSDDLPGLMQLAHGLQLKACWERTNQLLESEEGAAVGEACLLRAQLKLLTADATMAEDFLRAEKLLPNGSEYELFWDTYAFTAPNSFLLFPKEPDSLQKFLEALRKSRSYVPGLCGDVGSFMIRQIESEILYYMGMFSEALAIAGELRDTLERCARYDRRMLTEHVRLRCHLALGDALSAQKTIQQMIAYTESECASLGHIIYQTARAWVNLTTGWAGDTPRYYTSPTQKQYPIYEDRMEAMQWGIAELQETEIPLVEYARLSLSGIYTLRNLYAEVFEALLAFKYNDCERADAIFFPIYVATKSNKMVMPFAEYGKQIIPFLEYLIEKKPGRYNEAWMSELMRASENYEQMLGKYRDELR